MFKKRENVLDIEEGNLLSPKFDNDGLIPVITMCSKTKDVLMHGYMNVEAFKKTIETKEAHYFSRSRKTIWHKGKTSGFTQKVTELRIDDDQDSIWMTVDIGDGASCHVGYRSCFYRSIPMGPIDNGRKIEMKFLEKEKKFDPEEVYKGQPNPTKIKMSEKQKNVLGEDLEECSNNPLTGWYRDGCCNTDENDHGIHTVCAKVTTEFLEWLKVAGNDLITPHPEFGFPGLKDGDGWCVCASWYAKAVEADKGCPVFLKRTHKNTLKHVPIETLKKFAIDLS